jgi:murein DD-endopeptidase MepM/ murein hydrolase activator NlpD
MFHSRLNCSRRVRQLASLLSLLVGAGALAASTTALAEPGQLNSPSTRSQRPIADDVSIDQTLLAAPVSTAGAHLTVGGSDEDAGATDQHMATLGPAMRALRPLFAPLWPSRGEITTYFGEVDRFSPRGHAGLDIAADWGTPILAVDEGEVLKAYWNDEGYGGLVVLAHPSGYETWYGHLSRLGVEPGAHVTRGEQIGRMGSTGYSTGSHLHFEVRQDGVLRDPLKYLSEAALQPASH